MRGKFVVSLALAALCAPLVGSNAWAATIKPGANCSKLGQKTTQKSVVYTCIKSGKKLVWNKGTVVAVAPDTPTSNIPLKPSSISFDSLPPLWVHTIAREKVNEAIASLPQPANPFTYLVGANTRADLVNQQKTHLELSAKAFSKYFVPKSMTMLFFSEKDGAWAHEEMNKRNPSYSPTIPEQISSNPHCNFGATFAGGTGWCLDSSGLLPSDHHNAAHEYFHQVQGAFVGWDAGAWDAMPCWLLEGSATFFGITLGMDAQFNDERPGLKFIGQLMSQFNPGGSHQNPPNDRLLQKLRAGDGATVMRNAENGGPGFTCLANGAYSLGTYATEALVAARGFDTFMEFIKSFENKKPWKANFSNIYGLDVDDFYTKLSPYLLGRAELAAKEAAAG